MIKRGFRIISVANYKRSRKNIDGYQKSSKMGPKSSFRHTGVRFFRFCDDLIEVRLFYDFVSGQNETNLKNEGGGVKIGFQPQGSAEHLCSPKSFWSKEFVIVCKESWTLCPLRAGGGGLLSLWEFRRPIFNICFFKSQWHEFQVRCASFWHRPFVLIPGLRTYATL